MCALAQEANAAIELTTFLIDLLPTCFLSFIFTFEMQYTLTVYVKASKVKLHNYSIAKQIGMDLSQLLLWLRYHINCLL